MVNVVIYARFSSHSQTEQSIEGQLKECYEFAKRNDYNVIAEYIDRALTGTTDKRPEFLRMIEDSKKKAFKYVLVYQLDRFARNRYDSATYKAKLKKNGVRVLSAKENNRRCKRYSRGRRFRKYGGILFRRAFAKDKTRYRSFCKQMSVLRRCCSARLLHRPR